MPGTPAAGNVRVSVPVFWSKDTSGRYINASASFGPFFGLGEESPVGRFDHELFPAEIVSLYVTGDQEVMRLQQPLIIEEIYTGGWLETIKQPLFDDQGTVIGTYGFARDISEQRSLQLEKENSERNYRSLAENSPDIILRFDRQGLLIYRNPAAGKFSGQDGTQEIGRPPEQHGVLLPADAEHFSDRIAHVFALARPDEIEFCWEKAGQQKCVQMHLVPEFDANGGVNSVLAVGRDITALRAARAQLRKSHDVLHALANHRQNVYEAECRNIAHLIHEDLAQSLSALRMHLALLCKETPALQDGAVMHNLFNITDSCIARTRDIVMTLRPTVLDMGIAPALRWLANDFRKGLGLQFTLDLPEDLPLDDEITTFLFRSTQEALLNTALHAGATEVRIALQDTAERVLLTIEDNGRGFASEHDVPEGAFGLIGIAEQAQYLGGHLAIAAQPGAGTSLEISIPKQCRLPAVPSGVGIF